MRLRQAALAVTDLEEAGRRLGELFSLGQPYRDPGLAKYGLVNQVFAFKDTFLEIVAPAAANTSAGRLIAKRGGDCGYMVILQVNDIVDARARAAAAGARTVDALPPGPFVYTHLHPKDVGGAILSLDWMDPPERWEWAGPDWRLRSNGELELLEVVLGVEDLDGVSRKWSAVLGREVVGEGHDRVITLDAGRIRFRPAPDAGGEGLRGLRIGCAAPHAVLARARMLELDVTDGEIAAAGVRMALSSLPES